MPAPAPPANLENAVRDYVSGEGCQVASARHRVSQQRLRAALIARGLWRDSAARYGLAKTKTGKALAAKAALPVDDIVARYLAGESTNALAKAFGVSRKSIDYRLDAAGVTRRGPTEANRLMASKRTPEENAANVRRAHEATRGRTRSIEERSKGAATREQRGTHGSDLERALADMLRTRGLDVTTQKAVGPYNVDIATRTVAVEVFGGGWHAYGGHRERASERLRYILDQGWNLVIVWASRERWPIGPGACDYIVAFDELARRDPSIRGEYRVIWGDGQDATTQCLDVDDISVKPTRSGRNRTRPTDESAG